MAYGQYMTHYDKLYLTNSNFSSNIKHSWLECM